MKVALSRFYEQNKKTIFITIGIIVAVIVVLQILNNRAKKEMKERMNQTSSNIVTTSDSKYNSVSLESQQSVLSGDEISTEQKNRVQIIDEFFQYCNEKKIEEAYNLLTEKCKQEMYPTKENFEKGYYEKVLNGESKSISVENWTSNIYKVNISQDFLSSGKYTKENTIQDYITVERNDNKEYKLNINGYIGKTKPNTEIEKKSIKIKVTEKNTYMDYVIYSFEVTNNSVRTILLDDLVNLNTLYLEDNNNVKYEAYTNELSIAGLQINSGETKTIKIKYYSKYSSAKSIDRIVFSRVILNYETYLNIQDKNNYGDYERFQISI